MTKPGIMLALGLAVSVPRAATNIPADRTVYISVLDDSGQPVSDLTPADLVVKEGGKERTIVKVERASTPLRLALAVEERLTADTAVRTGLFEIMKRLSGAGEISLITIGVRNTTIVDYTTSLEALVEGIRKLTLNPPRDNALAEGVLELANRFIDAKPARPVIVAVAVSGGRGSLDPHLVLERLGQSGATMYAVTLLTFAPPDSTDTMRSDQVIGDGSRQSGGRRIEVTATGAMPRALLQVANELLAQYAVTYTLPASTKLDRRLNVNLKRRGVSLRAPSIIPDK